MKMSKLEGIQLLENLNLPTINRLDINQIIDGRISVDEGVSVRVSPKGSTFDKNVGLPSMHNCKDIEQIKEFINSNRRYNIFAHYTVKPEVIGSISKLEHTQSIVIETYRDFYERKKEIIDNRVIIPILFDRLWISKMEILKKDEKDFRNFKKVILLLKDIPFKQYDIEYVIQNGDVILTDLTLPNVKEYHSYNDFFREKEECDLCNLR